MKVKTTIHKALHVFGFDITLVPSPLFHPDPVPLPKEEFQVKHDRVYLKRLHIDIPNFPTHPLIVEYHHAKRIVEQLKGKFFYDHNSELKLLVGGIELYITEPEVLFIISEVFVNGSYNIICPNENMVIVDIGMNVATTALFFAARNDVQKVYAYELFPLTYKQAEKNIQANACGTKILAHPFGLGKENVTLELPYATRQKGRMGLNGLPKDEIYDNVILQEVLVKKSSNEIRRIRDENPGAYIVCKMDCEGAEYEIMEELAMTNTIQAMDAYMIEWHYKKPDNIVEALKSAGFTLFYLTLPSDESGMLYAIYMLSANLKNKEAAAFTG